MLELSTGYLASRRSDVAALKQALVNQDFEVIEKMIHKTKGTAGGYGFEKLGFLAKTLEEAAKSKDPSKSQQLILEIESYLNCVQIQG
jgi:HPt (histidine-containing phosphotransfer) domain-containing protein